MSFMVGDGAVLGVVGCFWDKCCRGVTDFSVGKRELIL